MKPSPGSRDAVGLEALERPPLSDQNSLDRPTPLEGGLRIVEQLGRRIGRIPEREHAELVCRTVAGESQLADHAFVVATEGPSQDLDVTRGISRRQGENTRSQLGSVVRNLNADIETRGFLALSAGTISGRCRVPQCFAQRFAAGPIGPPPQASTSPPCSDRAGSIS